MAMGWGYCLREIWGMRGVCGYWLLARIGFKAVLERAGL